MDKQSSNSKEQQLVEQNLPSIGRGQQVKEEKDLLHGSDASSLSKHNELYTTLLKAYIDDFILNSENKRNNKRELFKISKQLLLLVPTLTMIVVLLVVVCLAKDRLGIVETIVTLISALTTLLGTLLIIPKMITKYLFNKKEDEYLANIIEKIQDYDSKIREQL